MTNFFGRNFEYAERPENDPFQLAESVPVEKRPRMFLCCGEEDFLLVVNRKFYDKIKDGYDTTAFWGIGGHEFVYWNERLKDMFKWFCPAELEKGVFMGSLPKWY